VTTGRRGRLTAVVSADRENDPDHDRDGEHDDGGETQTATRCEVGVHEEGEANDREEDIKRDPGAPGHGEHFARVGMVFDYESCSELSVRGNVDERRAALAAKAEAGETPMASENSRYVAIDATTMRASTVIKSMPTRESRTQASITIPLSRTRSRTSITLLPAGVRSTAIRDSFAASLP